MKLKNTILKVPLGVIAFIISGHIAMAQSQPKTSVELFNLLAQKDSLFFDGVFKTCDIKKLETMFTGNYVFYHDKGYFTPTEPQTRDDFMKNLRVRCDDINGPVVRREIVKGSLQVFSAGSDGAMQLGEQLFFVITPGKKDQLVEQSKFTREWRKKNGDWKMERELDYLVNTKFSNSTSNSLYNEIAHVDSLLFNAFNAHDIEAVNPFFDKGLEFYHDKGGLSGYNETIAGLKHNMDENKDIRRNLEPGSLEVYPIKDYGAVEIGSHRFCHHENGKEICGTFKFVHVWQKKDGAWKITRVVSYDH